LNDRIEEDDSGSDNDGCGGQEHGTEARRARVHQPLRQGYALLTAQLDEVHEDDGVPDDDASARDETDHGYGSEERAHRGVRRQDADKGQRDWSHDDQRSFERFEPADNQDVDKHQDRRECQSQIAEDFG
jgi:hypothetical protein